MLLNTIDVDIIKMNVGEAAHVLRVNTIPSAAVILAVIHVPKYTERTIRFFNVSKMIFLQCTLNTAGKSISNIKYLLPKD